MTTTRRFGTNRPPVSSAPATSTRAPPPESSFQRAMRKAEQASAAHPSPADAIEAAAATAGAMPALLKPKDVADLLAVSERTLERWRITGEGPRFVRLGSKVVRYTGEEVEAFVAARVKANTGQ